VADKATDPIELPEYRPWRRIIIFLAAFILSAAASLSYVYTRPAEYRATSRLQISPTRTVAEADQTSRASLADQAASFLTEVQALTSRPVLEDAVMRLTGRTTIPADLGRDPVGAVQRLLQARRVERTEVVELVAEGPERQFLEGVLNTVAEAYRDRTARLYKEQSSREYQTLKDESENVHAQAIAARAKVDVFREANGIVSEEGENLVIADLQNLSRAYTASGNAFAKWQAQLSALKTMLNPGLAADSFRSDPGVYALEQRAAALKEQLADLQHRFTPQYLALDPDTRSLPGRIADLDRQIAATHRNDQSARILAAEQEFQNSELELDRLRRDLADRQKTAEAFAARLAEHKVMQENLGQLEEMERLTADHLTNLQASQREKAPRLEILQPAVSSPVPVRPDYTANALIAIAASFGLGIVAAWLSRFLVGRPAVAYWDAPSHMRCWDGAPRLTFYPATAQHFANDTRLIRLLPPPDPAPLT
jgi:succinoglycan biosynthesis transport protein ExoP